MARRIVRPVAPPPPSRLPSRRQLRLQTRLDAARRGFERWLGRLKRACRAVAKHQAQISRLERRIHQLEEP